MQHQYCELVLDKEAETAGIEIGVPYSCIGKDESGTVVQTHWMFCTSRAPRGVFGITRDWRRAGGYAPLLAATEKPILKLEPVSDLTAVYAPLSPGNGIAQAQLGHRGWLVMTCLTMPHLMGFLIEDPLLPPIICEGTEDLTIAGSFERTMQSVGLSALTCVQTHGGALFLKEAT